jgi:hypothetical protein
LMHRRAPLGAYAGADRSCPAKVGGADVEGRGERLRCAACDRCGALCAASESPGRWSAGFGVSSAFATTVAASRMINYVRERRRRLPWLRSLGRRVYHSPGVSRVRVHHFTPGVVMILAAGGGSIFARSDGREVWFSLPFGVGAGLTLDELGLLLELDNPY